MNPFRALALILIASATLLPPPQKLSAAPKLPATTTPTPSPPPLRREFRGLWIATVGNIDWPSKPGLPSHVQKAELIQILDQAQSLRLNAIILQVRPSADALYPSKLEPWSEYLSGKMGTPPSPAYDPLEFAIHEAHQRGLELHAWFNPFRARFSPARSPIHPTHISRTHPSWIRTYGNLQWMDPGLSDVQAHTLQVITDVAQRYDVDGIHLDDYFYPYPDSSLQTPEFPDHRTYEAYQAAGGSLSKTDWRRGNVNFFVESLYRSVHKIKPWVKVGISPFGIWRPDHPPGIRGLDAYNSLFADARLWLQKGWIDYLAPQLYWPIDRKEQSFPTLLRWWQSQNTSKRHLWPGLASANLRKDWKLDEIQRQIALTRDLDGCEGHLHWGANVLLDDARKLSESLKNRSYQAPALTPAFPWMDPRQPATPELKVTTAKERWTVSWKTKTSPAAVANWVVQTKWKSGWTSQIVAGTQSKTTVTTSKAQGNPEIIAVTAMSRTGIASPTSTHRLLSRTTPIPPSESSPKLPAAAEKEPLNPQIKPPQPQPKPDPQSPRATDPKAASPPPTTEQSQKSSTHSRTSSKPQLPTASSNQK